jgi:hypothetical protein
MISLSYYFRIGLTTVSTMIRETCKAIFGKLCSQNISTGQEIFQNGLQLAKSLKKFGIFHTASVLLMGKTL